MSMKNFNVASRSPKSLNPILAGTVFCHAVESWINVIYRLNPILAGTGFCQKETEQIKQLLDSLNPILAGTGFCQKFGFTDTGVFLSQSYSCWYWVLSKDQVSNELICSKSQSYSCWYWVLSISFTKNTVLTPRLNPILARTGFCRKKLQHTLYRMNTSQSYTFCYWLLSTCLISVRV